MKPKFILYITIFLSGIVLGSFFTYSFMKKSKDEVHISHSVVINKMEQLGRLEVIKYNIQDIIEYKKMRQWLPNAKTALLIDGEIIGCVDLSKINEERVTINGDSIMLVLPRPEICHVKVDHKKSRIYDMSYGLWESAQLMDEAYKYAQIELEAQANRLDITTQAKENTILTLSPILGAFGFQHISIFFDDDINTPNR